VASPRSRGWTICDACGITLAQGFPALAGMDPCSWTYHRAKGLEWPVVVLASLDRDQRRSPFDVTPESDRPRFDPSDPLGGRWIRYWPWPFGAQRKAQLAAAAADSAEGRRVREREERERVRLLYVGFTRARDHLVFAVRRANGKPRSAWLDELEAAPGQPLVALPVAATDGAAGAVQIGSSLTVPARVFALAPDQAVPVAIRGPARRFSRSRAILEEARPHYRIAPSRAAHEWPELGIGRTGEIVFLSGRVDLRRAGAIDWESAGRAIHTFLAADPPGLAADQRRERATRLLARAGLIGHLRPDWLLASSDALRAFIASRWPAARVHHEMPLTAFHMTPHGRRRIEGTIDLLVDAGPRSAVIDHKSFPAWSESACRVKSAELSPQLLAYAHALALIGRPAASLWFHFPLAGVLVEVIEEPTP
jgi:ATP-dependent helicase/nuclease subunit A